MATPEQPNAPTFVLAPIRGVTNAAFRHHVATIFGGFDAALAPYVVAEKGKYPSEKQLRDALPHPSLRTIPQVLTNDADAFVDVARAFLEAGSDEVNWNLGCPYPMVTKRKRGAGLLPDPSGIDAFLSRAIDELGTVVSVKLRLGLEDAGEARPVLEVLDRHPLREVTLHPRTAREMYGGTADVSAFAQCQSLSRHRLTYNGDIVDVGGFRALQQSLPFVERWMIGRGAVANPFLVQALTQGAQRPQPDLGKLEVFHDAMLEHHRSTLSGPSHVLHKMRELWGYWARSFDPKSKAIKKILRAKRLEVQLQHAREVFDGAARWTA